MIVAPLLAAGLLSAACGGSSAPSGATSRSPTVNPYTAAKIVPAMQAAVKSATSVHIAGAIKDNGQQISLDMSFQGSNASGSVTQGGQSYTILVVDNKAYIKVNPDFLKAANLPSSDCSSMCGKYVSVPQSQMSQLAGSLSLSSITNQFVNSLPASVSHDTTDVFSPATLNGQPVLQLTQGPYTIDVASTGTPYLLYISDSSQGSVTFSQWNSVPPLTPPPAAQIINL